MKTAVPRRSLDWRWMGGGLGLVVIAAVWLVLQPEGLPLPGTGVALKVYAVFGVVGAIAFGRGLVPRG